jgi:hypothetical protein
VRAAIERLPGAHRHESFAGTDAFSQLSDAESGALYLTDCLARDFDRVARQSLGLDRRLELLPEYFAHYRRVVDLSQSDSAESRAMTRVHADCLGLEFAERHTGLRPLQRALDRQSTDRRE